MKTDIAWRGLFARALFARALGIVGLAALLTACTGAPGTQDDKMGRFLVAPGKYTLYNCDQLQVAAAVKRTRELELEALIAKAGPSAAGSLAADLAYRPEYYQVHGEMNELRQATAEKNCKFVPGVPLPGTEVTPATIPVPR